MRWVAGILLVGAAALKAVELVTDPAAALVHPLGPYFVPVEIGIETGLGLLLLSGLYWRRLKWLVALLFTGFAGYSLYLALNGAKWCGCFGPLHINPWWTLGLDSVVALGLLVSALLERRSNGNEVELSEAWFSTKAPSRHHAVAFVMGVAVIFTALLFRYAGQRMALANGLITTAGDLVILEPERWIGRKLPIAESVDLDLSNGEWVVLLHRYDCSVCQKLIPQFERRAATGERIALVEVPPYGEIEPALATRQSAGQHGRLKDDREWFVQTPVEIRLQDGIVTAVKTHEH